MGLNDTKLNIDRQCEQTTASLNPFIIIEKKQPQNEMANNALTHAREFLYDNFQGMRGLYERYHEPYQINIENDCNTPFRACYIWDKKMIKIWTPESPEKYIKDTVNTIDLGLADEYTLSRKAMDWNVLTHEDTHNIFINAWKQKSPNITNNMALYAFNESFSVLSEIMLIKALEKDKTNIFSNQEKEDMKLIFKLHRKKYSPNKLEDDITSKYTEWDERMLFYKVYEKFGEEGVVDFFERLDYEKVAGIKRYDDKFIDNVLTEEYKTLLDMDAETLVKEFTR